MWDRCVFFKLEYILKRKDSTIYDFHWNQWRKHQIKMTIKVVLETISPYSKSDNVLQKIKKEKDCFWIPNEIINAP